MAHHQARYISIPTQSSSSRAQSPQPPGKKAKIFRACFACVSSKTRCEDVTQSGCLRCRSKNKECSLIQEASASMGNGHSQSELITGWSNPSHERTGSIRQHPGANEGIADIGRKLEAIDDAWRHVSQRLGQIEDHLTILSHASPNPINHPYSTNSARNGLPPNPQSAMATPTGSSGGGYNIGPIPRGISSSAMATAVDVRGIQNPEDLFTLVAQNDFPDVVRRGLMSQDQVDMAFHLFKHRFASLIPIPSYLLASTSSPTHPFAVIAFLAHTSPSPSLTALIEESVLMVAAGANSHPILLALFILSMAPLSDEPDRAPLSAFRLICMAYQAGLNLGLEVDTEALLKKGKKRLTENHWEEALEKVMLWELIKSRYNILTLAYTRSTSLAGLRAEDIPPHPASHFASTTRHLRAEAELVDFFKPFALDLSIGETEWLSEMPDLDKLIGDCKGLMGNLEMWRAKWMPTGVLLYESHCIPFVHGIRLSCLVQRLPSPLHPDLRIAGLGFTGVTMMQRVSVLIGVYNSIPDSEMRNMPSYLVMLFAVCLIAGRRCVSFIMMRYPDAKDSHIKETSLGRAEDKMRSLGGLARKALDISNNVTSRMNHFPHDDDSTSIGHSASNGDSYMPLDFDFMALFQGGLPENIWDVGTLGWDWGTVDQINGGGATAGPM